MASSTPPVVAAPPRQDLDVELAVWERNHARNGTPVTDADSLVISGSERTTHRVGQDPWWAVGFHLVAAVNTAFILGYPALIMAFLGWVGGLICLIGGGVLSFYNNCLLGSLHETNGIRHIRYRDLCGHIYGSYMYNVTWIIQYFNLGIANVGLVVLGGQSLKAIAGDTDVQLASWIFVAGIAYLFFAAAVPSLSALRYFSAFTLVLSCIYTFIAFVISVKDGIRAEAPRDYSLVGSPTDQAFNAMGAFATIAFAFNTGILPEMQATIKRPTTSNIYKALGVQYTVGTLPFLVLTVAGYWAYGNVVYPYMIINLSGPSWAILLANACACLQALVVFHIFASPLYEFADTFVAPKFIPGIQAKRSEYSLYKIGSRLIFRGNYIVVSTFLAALLPFFGDFIALTGALAAFSLQGGFIHHMIIKVRGNSFGRVRLTWHWLNVVVNVIVTIATVAAAIHYIVHDSVMYHAFANI